MPTELEVVAPVECCVPLTAKVLKKADAEATAALFKALSDPHRVQIVNLLANSSAPVCACDMTDVVGLSQPTMSFHLKKLTDAGLIHREARGTWAYYSLNQNAFGRLAEVVTTKGATHS